jgi:hypothetical protein
MTVDRPIPKEDLAVLLASALGQDKSDEVIAAAARSLGLPRVAFSGEEVRAIFEVLAKAEGLIGVIARFATSRGDVDRLVAREARRSLPVASGPLDPLIGRPAPTGLPKVCPRVFDLTPLLAPALGAEKARDAIVSAAEFRGLDASGLSHASALVVLDEIAKIGGIVGVVARFAKARFLLDNPGD